MTIKAIAGYSGYVEHASVAPLIFVSHGEEFPTRVDAARSLAHQLFACWWDEEVDHKRVQRLIGCCKKAESDAKFCPECGRKLVPDLRIEDFFYWIGNLHGQVCDGFPQIDEYGPWSIWAGMSEFVREAKAGKAMQLPEYFDSYMISLLDPKQLELTNQQIEQLQNDVKGLVSHVAVKKLEAEFSANQWGDDFAL